MSEKLAISADEKTGKLQRGATATVKVKGSARTGHVVHAEHEATLRNLFNTDHDGAAKALLGQCLAMLHNDEADDAHWLDQRDFVMVAIRDLAPRDAVERMLAVQMVATHVATIRAARWMAKSENLPQIEAHYTGFTKLARTYAAQVEAMRKHRTGGEQKVIVQHVTVAEGGQAIVGNVQHGGRGDGE